MKRTLPLIATVAFVAGFWTACSIGFDPTSSDAQFSCLDNTDCISPNICRGGICAPASGGVSCTDADDDGYGAAGTEVADCPKCREEGLCEEDCNDNDASINPGLVDTCDGKDNNCNGEVDEPTPCMVNFDCPDEGNGTLPKCENGTCVYLPPNTLGECAGVTLACVGGMREDPPAACQ